jgi:hypothetical protein
MVAETWRGVTTLALGAAASPWKLDTASAPMLLRRVFRLALLAGALAIAWKHRRNLAALSLPGLLAIVTAAAFLLGRTLTTIASTPWDTRHWLGLLIPALLLPVAIARAIGPRTLEATVVVLLVGSSAASIDSNHGLAKAGDSERVARTLERIGIPGEPVLIVPADNVLSLAYYYGGPNQLVPVPRAPSLETYRHDNLFPSSATEVHEALEPLGSPTVVWVYVDGARAAGEMSRFLAGDWREDRRLPFWDGAWLIHFRREGVATGP